MSDRNIYKRVADCEAICNQVRSQKDDVLQSIYDEAVRANDAETAATACRMIRNHLLEETDKYMLTDRPYSEVWATYREALRELPEQPGFPFDVTFPEKPEDK